MPLGPPSSHLHPIRCTSPESPLTSSLQLATSTIDELTVALANFSRVPSPEPSPITLTCCCGSDDCENAKSWLTLKNQLESRLTLSAEVGQALLKRHEAYIRRAEAYPRSARPPVEDIKEETPIVDHQYEDLLAARASLQKRLDQALVDNEVVEASNKTILLELQEAREVISRLSTSNARSIGWEARLAAVIQEKEDMQQERDSETQKAKIAEARINALKERTGKLQAEVRRLQMDLEQRRIYRLESSDHILKEARTRLESLQRSVGQSAEAERTELTAVLQSLVVDNEALKRDVGELQDLLGQSREEYNELQQEAEEQRASLTSRPQSSLRRGHMYSASVTSLSPVPKDQQRRRAPSDHRTRYSAVEPLSPAATNRTPRSPSVVSPTASSIDLPWVPLNLRSPTPTNPDDSESVHSDAPEHARTRKPLLLLTRSRGVQTEPQLPSHTPSPFMTSSSFGGRSESSSISESQSHSSQMSPMNTLVDRISALLARLNQADALTLTNRLKRQHIQGADVSHISRTTINTILSDLASLRASYRSLLEDESAVTACNRKDLRALFKVFREAFASLAELRITLNDVILDPSLAPKISERALGLSLAVKDDRSGQGWMAPISKLFGGPAAALPVDKIHNQGSGLTRSKSSRTSLGSSRLVPKLEPALSATTTIVNVEFSGSGVGRSVAMADGDMTIRSNPVPNVPQETTSTKIMDIFAGAPARIANQDPWVVVPRAPRRIQSIADGLRLDSGTLSPHSGSHDLSHNTDVSLDDTMLPQPLSPHRVMLDRTLRRRGLSDSSMRSTFISHAADSEDGSAPDPGQDASMLSSLTKRVLNLRLGATIQSLSYEAGNMLSSTPAASLLSGTTARAIPQRLRRSVGNEPVEAGAGDGFFVGSAIERGHVYRNRLGTGREFL